MNKQTKTKTLVNCPKFVYPFPYDGYCFLWAYALKAGIITPVELVSRSVSIAQLLSKVDIDLAPQWIWNRANNCPLSDCIDDLELSVVPNFSKLQNTSNILAVFEGKLGHLYYHAQGDPDNRDYIEELEESDMSPEILVLGGRNQKGRRAPAQKWVAKADQKIKEVVKDLVKENKEIKNEIKQTKQKKKISERDSKGRTKAGSWLRTAGKIAGGFLGNSAMGEQLGAGISRIFGQGDYQIRSNTLMNGGPPNFADLKTGMRVSHREYIKDISSTTVFANETFQISPSNTTMFPWLSRIANNFEEYTMNGLIFYFNTTCGSAISSTNNALGTVGMVSVYDPTDADLGNKRECEDYVGCVAGVPAQSIVAPLECAPRANVLNRLYVNLGNVVPNNEDWKFYSMGKLNVFTQGMQAAGITLGELWVSYDITFFNPKIQPVGTVELAGGRAYKTFTTGAAGAIYGTSPILATDISGNLQWSYAGNNQFTIPSGTAPGNYYFSAGGITDASTYVLSASATTNCTLVTMFQNNTVSTFGSPNAANANVNHGLNVVVNKTSSAACVFTITIASGTVPVNGNVDVFILKLPPTLTAAMEIANVPQELDRIELMLLKLRKAMRPSASPLSIEEHKEEYDELDKFSYDSRISKHDCKSCKHPN